MRRFQGFESSGDAAFGAGPAAGLGALALVALLGSSAPILAEGAADARAAAEATGALRSREAQGWLRLDEDRRQARARAEPMTPAESRRLQTREIQERTRLAETFQDQRRQIEALRRSQRIGSGSGGIRPSQEARTRGLTMRQGREIQELRLRQGLNRSIQGGTAGRFGGR